MIFLPRAEQNASLPGLPSWQAALLSARNVRTKAEAERFLHPKREHLRDPLHMPGMREAVKILREAKNVVVYGDYDADGVCACAILLTALRRAKIPAKAYIPSRESEGYGLNADAVKKLRRAHTLVTVDCGITSVNEVALAKEYGMRVIVTDHHLPRGERPAADALVTPEGYEGGELCGAGVAWKLSLALLGEEAYDLIDLAALATIADMVPLTNENRAIASLGLERINTAPRLGLLSLIRASHLRGEITADAVAFSLAPRINAGGRMDSARDALDLLLSEDEDRASALADNLDALNVRRKNEQSTAVGEAEAQLQSMDLRGVFALVFESEGWNKGVVGLAAGRLAEKTGLPTVVLSTQGDECTGSARSAGDVDLFKALSECADLFLRFGGHAQAAGLTIKRANLPELRRRLSLAVSAQTGGKLPVIPVYYDTELPLPAVTEELIDSLRAFEPCGMGNPRPAFLLHGGELVSSRRVGLDGAHLKLSLCQQGALREGVGFSLGEQCDILPPLIDAVFTPVVNEFNGRRTAEVRVEAVLPSSFYEDGYAALTRIEAGERAPFRDAPTIDELRLVYVACKAPPPSLLALSHALRLSPPKCLAALLVLRDLRLVAFTCEPFALSLMDKRKCDPMESDLYRRMAE